MSDRVTFWTEGGGEHGMGHVSRCLSVACAARSAGLVVDFRVNDHGSVHLALDDAGFPYHTALLNGEVPETGDASGGVVVIDTRKDVRHLVLALKRRGRKVLVMDNMCAAAEADATVVPSAVFFPGRDAERIFGGPEYLIIGENFINSRAVRADVYAKGPLKLLVTFGGTDPNHITDLVVEGLGKLGRYEAVETTVVLGPASRPSDKLKGFIDEADERMNFLCGVKDMAPVMASADLAITAMGISVYELAFMGVPSVIIGNYRKDNLDTEALEGLGITRSLGYYGDLSPEDVVETVREFAGDRNLLREISNRARRLTDGRGAERIVKIITDLAAGRKPGAGLAPANTGGSDVQGN